MKLIAHACGPNLYPSNTILSARESLKNGADLIELDVQFTSDMKLAVFHDADLEKKYGVAKKCCEVTAEEFLSLRLIKDPAFSPHLLEHFFQCEIAPILLDLNDSTIEAVLNLVDQYNYQDKVVFGIHKTETAKIIKKHNPDAKILAFIPKVDQIEEFGNEGVNYIRLWERWLTTENIDRVKKSGAEFWIMTGGPQTEYRVGWPDEASLIRFAAMEPDGILLNDIPFAKSVLENL